MTSDRAHALALFALLALAGCGGRSSLIEPVLDGGVAGDAAPPDGDRSCPPECFVGHACCAGSCEGPPVPKPRDCCSCLPGEVNSAQRPDAVCGG